VKRQAPATAGDPGPGSLSQSFISYYRESRLISRDGAPTQGWLTKDGALELLSSSLNNSKRFSKKAINFSEFQAFRIGLSGLAGNSFNLSGLSRGQDRCLSPGWRSPPVDY
jgi:hypothetical protein